MHMQNILVFNFTNKSANNSWKFDGGDGNSLGTSSMGKAGPVLITVALSAIIVGSTLGNTLVLFAVRKDRNLHSPANFLIGSLAFTDLLVAFLVMPFSALYEILDVWVLGDAFCQIWTATDIACCTASILHLCAIALERHQSITNAIRYFSERRRHTVAPKIIVVWILAMCISIPPILGWKPSSTTGFRNLVAEHTHNATNMHNQCKVGHHPGYTVYATLGSFYIPLILLLVVYSRIYSNIHNYVKRSESRSRICSIRSDEAASTQRWKVSPKNQTLRSLSIKSREGSPTNLVSRHKNCESDITFDVQMKTACHGEELISFYSILNSERKIENREEQIFQERLQGKPLIVVNSTSNKSPTQNITTCMAPGHFRSVRNKRNTRLCRQMAVDELFPTDSHSPVRHSIPKQEKFDKKFVPHYLIARNFSSVPILKRRYSESDVSKMRISQQQSSLRKDVARPRTQTTGGRVHFIDDEIQHEPCFQKDDHNILNLNETKSGLPEIELFNERRFCFAHKTQTYSKVCHTKKKKRFQYRRSYWSCCSTAKSKRLPKRHLGLLQQSSISPMLRHSLSLRSKIKMLKAREIRAIRTLGTIVGAFVVCWLPFFIVTLAAPFCNCTIPRPMKSIVLWLGYCNSLLNPIIYGAFNRDFHAAFEKIILKRLVVFSKCRRT